MNLTFLPSSSVLIHSLSDIFVPWTPQKWKRMRLMLGLTAFTSQELRSGWVDFLLSLRARCCPEGGARLRNGSGDVREYRSSCFALARHLFPSISSIRY